MLFRFSAPRTFGMARNLGAAFLSLTALAAPTTLFAAPGFQALPGHIPAAVTAAQTVAPLDTAQPRF